MLGTVPETEVVLHKIMVPNGVSGVIDWTIAPGDYIVDEVVAKIKTDKGEIVPLTMVQKWPVRVGRPYKKKHNPRAATSLLNTERVFDPKKYDTR